METFFKYVLGAVISVVALMQFVQVITRYVFATPLAGFEEVATIFAMWLYVLGAVNASREGTQIRANVIEIFLKTANARYILFLVSESLSLLVSSWLTYWAWDYLLYAIQVGKETPILYLPTLIYEAACFTGLFLMTTFVVLHLFMHIRKFTEISCDQAANHKNLHTDELNEFQVLTQDVKEKEVK